MRIPLSKCRERILSRKRTHAPRTPHSEGLTPATPATAAILVGGRTR